MILIAAAAFVIAATTPGAFESPAPMSESVAKVRFAKLGYPNATIKLVGRYWVATVTKGSAPYEIRFDATSGNKLEGVPLRLEHPALRPPA